MNGKEVSVALVGMGGYGESYLERLLSADARNEVRFVAAADPAPNRCRQLGQVNTSGVPVFPSIEAMVEKHQPELVVLATPPQFHCEQTIFALEHGSHVLCEKPLGTSPDQVFNMIEARDRAKKQVAVGYQWSFLPAIQQLKADIHSGKFGKPKRFRTSVYWPRNEEYYHRNGWAGRIRDSAGRVVMDSPVNNACAHFLHNMFYLLGDRPDRSDPPKTVTAELYRANPIENYDTAAIRTTTVGGIELLFLATHATRTRRDPLLRFEFENAKVYAGNNDNEEIIAELPDGKQIHYGKPLATAGQKMIDVCRSIRAGEPVVCGIEAAAAQTFAMSAAQTSMPKITDFPKDLIEIEGEQGKRRTSVRGLEQSLNQCFDNSMLPSELGIEWARAGTKVEVGERLAG
jgi:predicted dehydrogenase